MATTILAKLNNATNESKFNARTTVMNDLFLNYREIVMGLRCARVVKSVLRPY